MTTLACDGIILTFDDAWTVEKWDDEPWYRDGIQRLNGELDGKPEGTKAVDVIGIRVESGRDIPFIFEVKDFAAQPSRTRSVSSASCHSRSGSRRATRSPDLPASSRHVVIT